MTPSAVLQDPLARPPLILGEQNDQTLADSLFRPVWTRASRGWKALFGLGLVGTGLLVLCICETVGRGVGMWGNNIPVAWAYGIVDFVWWIGIGHAGTLISAILLLFQSKWRTSINRMAEAMTLFAVICAGMFPLLHLGRPWFAYWLFPYPSTTRLWPQFKSPLTWDVFAVSTYLTVSFLFWYVGLLPDLAALRDVSKTRAQRIAYGIFALGWRGSARHWHEWRTAYLILAGLATPLVLSVHTIVSFDFAVGIVPGWHNTLFPPYFVAGAIFSGFAMVLTLLLPARAAFRLHHVITERHLENMCKVILTTSLMVAYGYAMEHFMAWYSADGPEAYASSNRLLGPFAPVYWALLFCNVLVPQIFWTRRARRNVYVIWAAALLINAGMWMERFVIVAVSLHRDFLPSSWRMYAPTWVDWGLLAGTISFFGTLFLLFIRFVPPVASFEVKELNRELKGQEA